MNCRPSRPGQSMAKTSRPLKSNRIVSRTTFLISLRISSHRSTVLLPFSTRCDSLERRSAVMYRAIKCSRACWIPSASKASSALIPSSSAPYCNKSSWKASSPALRAAASSALSGDGSNLSARPISRSAAGLPM